MNAIQDQILQTYTTAAAWSVSVATSLMALLAVAALLGFLIRKYSS